MHKLRVCVRHRGDPRASTDLLPLSKNVVSMRKPWRATSQSDISEGDQAPCPVVSSLASPSRESDAEVLSREPELHSTRVALNNSFPAAPLV